ncbi:MAG: hypothetical protein QW561_02915 [Candidatus Aenigmatarchaeota archaeon]
MKSMKKKKRNKKNTGRAMLLPYWLVFPSYDDYETDIDLGNEEFREYIMYVLRRGKTPSYFIPYNDN